MLSEEADATEFGLEVVIFSTVELGLYSYDEWLEYSCLTKLFW